MRRDRGRRNFGEPSTMNDQLLSAGILNTQYIDIYSPVELHGWAKSLGATRDEIRNAVAEVGPLIDKVIEHLSKH
jgi:Protein of unknown function (DUF3606)